MLRSRSDGRIFYFDFQALHPLLEDGCEGDDEAEKHKKVGFIGISNWALDPAKMNRGILVQRGSPDAADLEATARFVIVVEIIPTVSTTL